MLDSKGAPGSVTLGSGPGSPLGTVITQLPTAHVAQLLAVSHSFATRAGLRVSANSSEFRSRDTHLTRAAECQLSDHLGLQSAVVAVITGASVQ
jgi:hypothetical protein